MTWAETWQNWIGRRHQKAAAPSDIADAYSLVRAYSRYKHVTPDTPLVPEQAVQEEASATELIGWREWLLAPDNSDYGWCLYSPHRRTTWEGPVLTAHASPRLATADELELHDHPGIHAHRERDHLGTPGAFVRGRVALSGIVLVGTYGYRASRATIQRLAFAVTPSFADWFLDVRPLDVQSALEQRYQCPVDLGELADA